MGNDNAMCKNTGIGNFYLKLLDGFIRELKQVTFMPDLLEYT